MEAIRIQQTIQKRGEVTLENLPVEIGQQVEIIVLFTLPNEAKQPKLTAKQLLQSGLVGIWKDRQDIGDSAEYARQLREQAQKRPGIGDLADDTFRQ